ncbi:hypothetical protein PEX1_063430 [Penicillium expansum]|uniref:Uncharacterized protein n=1 Tax=Penicillium expansum TaxID=27334 RepID=A0A0A2JM72_PENEN|nr:hypothetical protein PEX2_040490 [Penicillium expansum]KGO45811.1 hypothetical protein PEXP_019340 [Penicillium expansum]KGO55931.1 hypothetical protein PEX1_063430 [Penicillium expansum]KGO57898.1 hypothetical protein PEX2_040490 [Penicillium expansum]
MNAYSIFREADPDGDSRPAFHNEDGVPLYEAPYQGLLNHILSNNDLASLFLYSDSPTTKVFWGAYEPPNNHPFILASSGGRVEVLKALVGIYLADSTLKEPIDSYLERIECSPMNDACAAANRDLMLWLLNHDPPLGSLHDRVCGDTPLFSAAQALGDQHDYNGTITARYEKQDQITRTEDFICFLLDLGCSVPNSDHYGPTYRETASFDLNQSRGEVVSTVLGAVIPHASYQMVSRLIAEGADVHAHQMWNTGSESIGWEEKATSLHIAALHWNLDGIQALADNLGDVGIAEMASTPDGSGRLPLHWALVGAKDRRVELFGRDDQEEITAHITRTVEVLLKVNPDTLVLRDQGGLTAFDYAVTSETGLASILPVVKLLLRSSSVPPSVTGSRNHKGAHWTLLGAMIDHYARRLGSPSAQLLELLVLLLENGADARACNGRSQNLLHTMAMFRDTDCADIAIIDKLLEFVDVNHVDGNGNTPLHLMVRRLNRINTVRHIISQGANVNLVDKKGNSPLHETMHGTLVQRVFEDGDVEPIDPAELKSIRVEMIQVLVDAGASMDLPNESGQTPLQVLDEMTAIETRRLQNRRGRGRGGRRPN